MMRRHGAAGFAEDHRLGQLLLATDARDRSQDLAGIGRQIVVDRAKVLRAAALVVDAQTAADIDHTDGGPQAPQFGVETRRLVYPAVNVAQIRDLRTDMRMQHDQPVQGVARPQALDQVEHLGGRQAELGLGAAGILPLARGDRRQAHAHPEQRLDPQVGRFAEHQLEFARLLDHDVHVETQASADQRQADVLAILVTVADDAATGRGAGQHGHQLGLAAGLEADTVTATGHDLLDHAALLVDLDRVDRPVSPGIAQAARHAVEGATQLADPVLQHVVETHQYRQAQAAGLQVAGQLVQIDLGRCPDADKP